jgi:hypothetical protein
MNTQLGGLRFASQRLQPRAMAGAFLYQMVAWAKVPQKWNGTVVTLPLPQVHTPVQIPKASLAQKLLLPLPPRPSLPQSGLLAG